VRNKTRFLTQQIKKIRYKIIWTRSKIIKIEEKEDKWIERVHHQGFFKKNRNNKEKDWK
jgi:hypothetical protein